MFRPCILAIFTHQRSEQENNNSNTTGQYTGYMYQACTCSYSCFRIIRYTELILNVIVWQGHEKHKNPV
jgi:hypothetical protein